MTAGTRTFSIEETFLQTPALTPPPKRHALFVCLVALAALLHIGTIGWGDLYGETEGQYAGAAREMIHAHAWLTPTNDGIPRLQKPPLLYWLIIISFKMFGINAAAARLPIALAIVASVALTFLIAERLGDYRHGFLAGLIFLCFWGMFLLGRMIMPEPVFAAFVTGSIFCGIRAYQQRAWRKTWFLAAWICAGFACLTKGIHGLIYPAAIFLLLSIFYREARIRFYGMLRWPYLLVFLAIVLPWHIWAELHFPGFFQHLFGWEWMGHIRGDPASLDYQPGVPRFQFLALHLAWLFPVSFAVLPGIVLAWRRAIRPSEIEFKDALPLCWMAVVFLPLLFLGERQDYYSFSAWSGFAIFTASAWMRVPQRLHFFGIALIAIAGVVMAAVAVFLPQIVGGAANEWKEMSERSNAWQTFSGIPGAAWLGFRPIIGSIAVAFLVGAAVAFYFAARERNRMALVTLLAIMLPLGLSSIDGVARVAPYFSLASAASYLNPRLGRAGDVYYEGPLHAGSSLVFYLKRRFYLVNQKPDPFAQQLGGAAVYADEGSVLDRWSGTDPVFLIIEQNRMSHWEPLITQRVHIFHQVMTCGTYVVLTNQL